MAGPLRRGDGPAEREGFPGLGGRRSRSRWRRPATAWRSRTIPATPSTSRPGSPPRAGWRSATPTSSRARGPAAWRSAAGAAWPSTGDHGPADVEQVPIRPVWDLSDDEERRTKQIDVRYRAPTGPWRPRRRRAVARPARLSRGPPPAVGPGRRPGGPPLGPVAAAGPGSSAALDRAGADRPGPGRGPRHPAGSRQDAGHRGGAGTRHARFYQPALLGLATTVAHVGSVLLIAAVLWYTGTSRVGTIHLGLARAAGFVIAASGFWRLGRHLGGHGEHEPEQPRDPPNGARWASSAWDSPADSSRAGMPSACW